MTGRRRSSDPTRSRGAVMTFLPIVDRELRVAARQPLAFLLRFFAALIATLFWLTLLGARSATSTPSDVGQTFFNIASVLLFIGCLFSGVFLTADAISNEKRDGTLGLLFLTDLRGYDARYIFYGRLYLLRISRS